MIKSGLKPSALDHRDFSFEKSFGAILPPKFPDFYNADTLGWLPDQNIAETEPVPHSAQPYGCTNMTSASIGNNLIQQVIRRPDQLEAITHANEQGGADIKTALKAAKGLGWIEAYYNVKSSSLDMFDSIRLALIEGAAEHRTVSAGTPWYAKFEAVSPVGVLKSSDAEGSYSWHNHEFSGWITINGLPHLIDKSWQGKNYADKGLCYWPRELVNQVFAVSGSCAYIPAKAVDSPARIDTNWLEYVISIIRQFGKSWLKFTY